MNKISKKRGVKCKNILRISRSECGFIFLCQENEVPLLVNW